HRQERPRVSEALGALSRDAALPRFAQSSELPGDRPATGRTLSVENGVPLWHHAIDDRSSPPRRRASPDRSPRGTPPRFARKPTVVRWPGGCFADSYDWHDGVGAPDKRPRRTDFWADTPPSQNRAATDGPQRFDPNRFGTNEFIRFCRLTGAAPYIAANVRS